MILSLYYVLTFFSLQPCFLSFKIHFPLAISLSHSLYPFHPSPLSLCLTLSIPLTLSLPPSLSISLSFSLFFSLSPPPTLLLMLLHQTSSTPKTANLPQSEYACMCYRQQKSCGICPMYTTRPSRRRRTTKDNFRTTSSTFLQAPGTSTFLGSFKII
jgi:hypothetical protein